MQQQEIPLDPSLATPEVDAIVDRCAADLGLSITMRSTLQTYPGSTHWHLKNGREAGVLEVTFWPRESRLWLSVHKNRRAPWIDSSLPMLADQLTEATATSQVEANTP